MQESCDTTIKLFGKKIPLPSEEDTSERDFWVDEDDETETQNKDLKIDQETKTDQPPDSNNRNAASIRDGEDDPNSKTEEKPPPLKKPDKILPCPRCNSMDTKFCYYNNYNVHQPRHFCKACQRYWTAGGTMRNVPVGAGRRKNKASSAAPPPRNFPHIPELDRCSTASSITTVSNSEESSANATSAPFLPWPLYPGIPMPFHPFWWFPPPPMTMAMAPVLGNKRPREGCVLVPKTLRIDDPSEAAKSSIWATLGIKLEGAGMFDGFQSKSKVEFGDDNEQKKIANESKASPVLMANPAALSRSINFHESS